MEAAEAVANSLDKAWEMMKTAPHDIRWYEYIDMDDLDKTIYKEFC